MDNIEKINLQISEVSKHICEVLGFEFDYTKNTLELLWCRLKKPTTTGNYHLIVDVSYMAISLYIQFENHELNVMDWQQFESKEEAERLIRNNGHFQMYSK